VTSRDARCESMTLAPLYLGKVAVVRCELAAGHTRDHRGVSEGRAQQITLEWAADNELNYSSPPSAPAQGLVARRFFAGSAANLDSPAQPT